MKNIECRKVNIDFAERSFRLRAVRPLRQTMNPTPEEPTDEEKERQKKFEEAKARMTKSS
ncbi:MAG: hypothetical protein WBO66_01480 [Candidatus Moraniibacteriota bacterium]